MGLKDCLQFLFFKKIKLIIYILPRSLVILWGRLVGMSIYFLDKKHRSIAQANLNLALGSDLSSPAIKKISRRCFIHFGQTFFDLIKFGQLSPKKKNKLIKIEGAEYLKKALARGKGVLLFSGHFGNWEVATPFLSSWTKLNVIARPLDNRLLEKELYKLRTKLGATVIYKQHAAKPILKSLNRGEMVAILIDQNVLRSQAIFVDFFNKKAATTPSLAAFYLRTKAALLPVFCYPLSPKQYFLKIYPPLKIQISGNQSQDLLKITQICTKIIENQIKKNPEYWFWFHRRWKTRP